MEKRKPHHKLETVKELITNKQVAITKTARDGAGALNLTPADILTTVGNLTAQDFYKSMTTYADHTIWQDVYRPTIEVGQIYLKLTVTENLLIVSFKEL